MYKSRTIDKVGWSDAVDAAHRWERWTQVAVLTQEYSLFVLHPRTNRWNLFLSHRTGAFVGIKSARDVGRPMIEQVSDDETNPPIYVCSYNVYQSKISYMTSELIALLFNRALSSENRDFYHSRFSQKQPPLKLNVAL